MSVPEQVPYKEYRATGSSNTFEITFYLPDPKDLVVMVNKEIPPVGAYSIVGDSVVFGVAPNEGDLVELTRDTQLDRETNFKSYDNSFRPETINFDLDKIWLVLQEANLVDAKILARLKQEIEWRRTHDFNYDELAQVREKQLFDALKGYTDTLNAATNPGVFQGVVAGVVFARDGKSIQTHLEEILESLAQERENIDLKADQTYVEEQLDLKANQDTTYSKTEVDGALDQKSSKVDTYTKTEVDTALSAVAAGHKAYTTLALAQAAQGTLPANTIVEVTNDPTASNNGTYQWNGTTLTKSAYDPLTQAKADATTKANAAEANAKNYTSQKIQSAIRSDQSNLKDQAAFAFTDSRGVRTWLEATEEGSPTEYARTSMLKSSGALIGIISNYSTGNAVTFVDSADRILGILNGDESASKEISSTSVDLSTWAFFGSSSMMYLQDDVFALLQNNFDQVRNAKYYGTSASRMQHTLANIGVNKASLSFVDGVIDNTARTVTPAGFEFGVPTIHTVNGQLENGIKGTYKDSTFTAASGSLTVSATTPIKFISDGSTHRNAVALVNIGKNNVAATGADVDVLAGTRAAVEYLDERNDRHTIVLGHFVNTDQTEIGKANIISLNNSLRSIYYDRFIDIQAYLMGDQVWSDVGLTKTQADIDAIAAGVLPPSLGRDNAHLSAAVDAKLAEKILNLVISKGWYA